MRFKQFIEAGIGFQTDKGSVYQFLDGKTIRNKSVHEFHPIDDHGVKPQSDMTVFIDPILAREIGMWQTSSAEKKRIILMNNHITLVSLNAIQQRHGIDKISGNSSYSMMPKNGLCPLELFQRDQMNWPWKKAGMQVFSGSHPGNKIVKLY